MHPRLPDRLRYLTALALLLAAPAAFGAIPESAYSGLRWRLAGPFRGGWATIAAGVPGDPATFYFGAADGGVWKTTDAGVTWHSLFDHEGSASIGALAVAPSDPRVLWVGTGQIQQRWDVAAGDGVYRSTDGGTTWTNVGLRDTRHVGAIWVDPRNPEVALVAALGHLFGPNEERGLFRTEDGGRTWTKVLYRDADTGAADLAGDPAHPDVLFASLWQVRRHPWLDYFQPPVGPGSAIYKSTDGGRTWAPAGKGLPPGPLGRIELAVGSGTQSRRAWAAVQTPKGGALYRTDDGAASWSVVNDDENLASAYTSGLTPDPRDPETVWAMGRSLRRSQDGGRTFSFVRGSPGGDDYHFLWIDPREPRRMIAASDQGTVVTHNGGRSWSSWYNQPTGQFYRLAVDDRFPYRIYSGQQDSGTVRLASRSDYGQLTFRDWQPVGGDERDGDVPDPADPDVVYGAGLGGRLSRWDARTGQVQNVAPWPASNYGLRPGTGPYRFPWITALAVASRPPHAIYLGAQVLFRSTDGGRTWATISPDLTGTRPATPGCEGDPVPERATACGFGTIMAIAPSAALDGRVWVGTENGRVQLTTDGGASWKDVTPTDLPDWTKVNQIDASPGDAATAYIAADGHRRDDPRPLAFRTHDAGATWTEIGHGLPAGAWVGVVRQDPERPGLLFAGTSRGVHVSFDDGDHWQALQLNLPTTGINDLLVHHGDLIAATQGRAIWILDAIEPLRHLSARALEEPVTLLPPPPAVRLRSNQNKDTPLPPEEPRGENPPVGALIDYVLAAPAEGGVTLEVVDAGGALVRRFRSDDVAAPPNAEVYFTDLWLGDPLRLATGAGHHRFVWDLRYPAPPTAKSEFSIAAVPGRRTPALPTGALVLPGRYEVRLTAGGRTVTAPLEVTMDPRVRASAAELAALLAFQREVEGVLAEAVPVAQAKTDAEKRLRAALDDPRSRALRADVERSLASIERVATGTGEGLDRDLSTLASLAADLEGADAPPTAAQRRVLDHYRGELARFEAQWRSLATGPLGELSRRLARRTRP